MMTCEKFVEGAESKPYICATCGGEQHLHPGACDHCGGHRTAPDGWALRQGFTPCPFCAPPLPAGLDFEKADRDAHIMLGIPLSHWEASEQFTAAYDAALNAQLQARIAEAVEGVRRVNEQLQNAVLAANDDREAAHARLATVTAERDELRGLLAIATDTNAAQEKLAEIRARRERDALATAVRGIEWVTFYDDENGGTIERCVDCSALRAEGHTLACRLGNLLKRKEAP